jgi:ubiquinol-cytochrome c reductase cytochrome c1 subunit
MRTLLATIFLAAFTQFAVASESGHKLLNAKVDLHDKASLQRGAKMFVNYCVSCHSAQYMRYNRVATDLGIPEDVMKANLMFTTDKVGEPMVVAMRPEDGQNWFGVAPPDL